MHTFQVQYTLQQADIHHQDSQSHTHQLLLSYVTFNFLHLTHTCASLPSWSWSSPTTFLKSRDPWLSESASTPDWELSLSAFSLLIMWLFRAMSSLEVWLSESPLERSMSRSFRLFFLLFFLEASGLKYRMDHEIQIVQYCLDTRDTKEFSRSGWIQHSQVCGISV